jgi:hypothetical protein
VSIVACAASGIEMSGVKWNCAPMMIVSASLAPSDLWMSHSARDQISPSAWTSPTRSFGVVLVAVDAAQAVRHRRRVRRGVPVGHAGHVSRASEVLGDGHGQVVAEGLADSAGVGGRAEAGDLVVLHRVAVLVDMTSASSASSTPPLPKVIVSLPVPSR